MKIKLLFILTLVSFLTICSNAQNIEYWGITGSTGTSSNLGTIYKTDVYGTNLSPIKTFTRPEGTNPWYTTLCEASNGKLYGMTTLGGTFDKGTIFEFNPLTESYTVKFNFNGMTGDGSTPRGSLIEASNGKLYGMTYDGGLSNQGVLFEYDPITNIYTKKFDFDGTNKGANPWGDLTQLSNGKIYGLAFGGGTNGEGVLFEYDPATNIYTKKVDFDNSALAGRNPIGGLVQASNGKLYAAASAGGANTDGALFEYDVATNIYTKKFDLGGTSGSGIVGNMVEYTNGKLYGVASSGGLSDKGTLFEYDPATNIYTSKIYFNSIIGYRPTGSLVIANNGKIYGTCLEKGGSTVYGSFFEYVPSSNTLTMLIDFDGDNGGAPYAGLLQASNGNLFGMTAGGGAGGDGVIFEYNYTSNTFTKKFNFGGAMEGDSPSGSLMKASNGKLYGMTSAGGDYGQGVLFEIDPLSYAYVKKVSFKDTLLGKSSYGYLMEASNGKLYGMTSAGGINDYGVLFEYDFVTSTYTKRVDFDIANEGALPYGGLTEASNGKLYGMTTYGGSFNDGVLFEYDPTTFIYTKKLEFNGSSDGGRPVGSMIVGANGNLYGMATNFGANGHGVLFEYNPTTSIYTVKIDFNDAVTGKWPQGNLVLANNGLMYGTTSLGGGNNKGALFEYNPIGNTCTNKINFDGTNLGSENIGTLMQASSGLLYGVNSKGGVNNKGVLFEYDFTVNNCTKKIDFNPTLNGVTPHGSLLEINLSLLGTTKNHTNNKVLLFPNPTEGLINIELDNVQGDTQINLRDITGKLIQQYHSIGQKTHSFEIKGNNGLYLIELISANQSTIHKVVKY